MLVFVDESGDAGFKLNQGSSDVFVVTLVIFKDNNDASVADSGINQLREEMHLHPSFEFKFNKLNANRRKHVLRRLASFDFQYHCLVVKKKNLDASGLTRSESFYKFACSLAFEMAREFLSEAIVIIDGSGSKEFRHELQKYLKTRMNLEQPERRRIAKVKINDSSKNNLLQFTDMICGAVSRWYKNRPDRLVYREIIRKSEGLVEDWPM